MRVPPIPNPQTYAGLYIYDFGTHVAVGYTAAEIRILRESEPYRTGTAYEIYRVAEDGAMELRGVRDECLIGSEAVCFLRSDAEAARRDYDTLRRAADREPVPCSVEMQLAMLPSFQPSHVTAIVFPTSATTTMSGWLSRHANRAGDLVVGGDDAYSTLIGSQGDRVASCRLPIQQTYRDRCAEEVLRSVGESLQR